VLDDYDAKKAKINYESAHHSLTLIK